MFSSNRCYMQTSRLDASGTVSRSTHISTIKLNNYLKLTHWIMQLQSFDWLSDHDI